MTLKSLHVSTVQVHLEHVQILISSVKYTLASGIKQAVLAQYISSPLQIDPSLSFWHEGIRTVSMRHLCHCQGYNILFWHIVRVDITKGFPGGSNSKESACNEGDQGLIPGLGRSSGGENGKPFQYSCLENSMDRGACQAIVHGVAKSQTWVRD